ncbi:hypothetical protein DEDE109153_07140 [Deinococcus deserti]|uniref:Uncharacterized protein n=1 Tax=Deinococcus deserti (strain DSM 17065 / CIP 109153 / LMG 22923 / VCD115) TaxID=546414 RepID=C1CWP3_DEIDV|nr:hypothetical protein [Deinococcus deserti]ACO46610.1 hypothetical protein Deide_16391 [Deinococcus deserti VCD115]
MTTCQPAVHPRPFLARAEEEAQRDEQLFGRWVMEVAAPGGTLEAPTLHDWEVRVWPVARLGDLTLEVRPLHGYLDETDLRAELRRQGYQVLGPVRVRRSD